MRVRAQVAMVMNLDKCIGCHTCSVTCKNVWTGREGTEYQWWNNVETKPGVGYPKMYEDQDRWKGGWALNNGKLELKAGGKLRKLANIFFNPDLPSIDDYYEPWTYDYETLTKAKPSEHQPVARPISQLSGEPVDLEWGPNWDDDLAGAPETGHLDPNIRDGLEEKITFEYEQVFMMYLPRICEHCLNPSCVASCPSGAMYKREEDGIVLVDQEQCRGWRYCVSGCPYKKTYFNWQTGKAEKCTLCYPRIENGFPTICSETCVGRLRYIGVVLYDADAIEAAASVPDEKDLLDAQRNVFLDAGDPGVVEQARFDGIPDDWISAAARSPIYKLAIDWGVALPLHPEYRTLPMVWYVPPLSPVLGLVEDGEPDPDDVFPAIDSLRIPIQYLANLLSAGDEEVVRNVLKKLAAMRGFMREKNLSGTADDAAAASVGMDPATMETVGYERFGGKMTGETFTAHPKIDPDSGNMVAIGYAASGMHSDDVAYFEANALPYAPITRPEALFAWVCERAEADRPPFLHLEIVSSDGCWAADYPIRPGRGWHARELVFEIVDPSRLRIEALAFDPALAADVGSATVAVGDQRVPLVFVGAARSLREQALPLGFRAQGAALNGLAGGQPVRVFVQTKQKVKGIPVPVASLMKSPANQTVVWVKTAPERFEPRTVTTEPLDGLNVAVTSGLKAGDRVATQGATLINQVR